MDQLAARGTFADNIHPREILHDLVLRQVDVMDNPELERRYAIALARVARIVAPHVLKAARPLVSRVGQFAAKNLQRLRGAVRQGARHAPRPRPRASGPIRARPRPNVRNVGRRLGRSMRTVNRAANRVDSIMNTVDNVRNTIDSFRGGK
jgi:hypothetical protein